jgi:hypothetical protein
MCLPSAIRCEGQQKPSGRLTTEACEPALHRLGQQLIVVELNIGNGS